MYPSVRLRRLRKTPWIRELVAEHSISVKDLVWPVFVKEGKGLREAVEAMPGVFRYSPDTLVEEVIKAAKLGIQAVAIFPVTEPSLKDENGSYALNEDNLVCRAVREVKAAVPEIGIICDVALDPYTSHGHDGLFIDGDVANDETVEVLCRQALTLAKAGADIVAPSDMMDGRVAAIRDALDDQNFTGVSILSYAAKYASCFYGPFRSAVGSAGNLGKADKKTYQMNPANADEAIREVEQDVLEGADMVMVKPGMPYLDVISLVSREVQVPVFAYQVSGEYSMLKLAAEKGLLDWKAAIMESLLGFKRAGASGIFTYAALEVAEYLKSN